MDKTAREIEDHIQRTRGDLGSNIQELENKVRSATDWKRQFQKNPMTMLSVAFGGGVLLAAMLGNGKHRGSYRREEHVRTPHAGTDWRKHQALETWDNIKGALIGVTAARFKEYISKTVPGFDEQYRRTEEQKRQSVRTFEQQPAPQRS